MVSSTVFFFRVLHLLVILSLTFFIITVTSVTISCLLEYIESGALEKHREQVTALECFGEPLRMIGSGVFPSPFLLQK